MNQRYDAFFVRDVEIKTALERRGNIEVNIPHIAPDDVRGIAKRLILARQRVLMQCTIANIVTTLDAVADAWLAPNSQWLERAIMGLEQVTGYSPQVLRAGVRHAFEQLKAGAMWQVLTDEFQDPCVLDEFRPRRTGGYVRAIGPRLIVHILAGNIPGIGVLSISYALMVKSASLVKLSASEPIVTPLFAQSLAEVAPDLASCIAVVLWTGGNEAIESVAFQCSDAVVAYGSATTIAAIRNRLPPTTRLIPYGHRISMAVIDAQHCTTDVALALARDIAMFDQQGCLSPQLIFVEGATENALEFGRLLASALNRVAMELPPGRHIHERASNIQQWRMVYQMAGAHLITSEHSVDWTVIVLQQPVAATPFAHSLICPPRTTLLRTFMNEQELISELEPLRPFLSTAGCAISDGKKAHLFETLARMGITRICAVGDMQSPPATWHHDGRPNLADLITWVDWESSL